MPATEAASEVSTSKYSYTKTPSRSMEDDSSKRKKVKEWKEEEKKESTWCSWKFGNWSWSTMYIWFIIAPIVIWFALMYGKPSFVTDSIASHPPIINNQKLLLWTLIFSVISWILIYAVYFCRY